MRILFLLNSYVNDAPNNLMVAIAKQLHHHQWDVVVCSMTEADGPIAEKLRQIGITKLFSIQMKSRFSVCMAIHQLSKVISCVNPDVVHAGLARPAVIASLLAFVRKYGVLTWTQSGIHEWSECKPIPSFFIKHLYRFLSIKASKIVAVSHGLRKVLIEQGLLVDRIVAIPNGIDLNKYRPASSKTEQLHKDLHIDRSVPLFGSAGNLRFVKGYDSLIKAFSELVKVMPNAHLVIWGTGPEKDNLMHLVDQFRLNQQVHLMGYTGHLPELLPELDVYVQPSRQEAFGLAACEALACDIPIVINDTSGLSDLVVPNMTGEKTLCNDANVFANAMKHVYCNRDNYKSHCRKLVCEHYSIDTMTSAYEALFCSLIAEDGTINE